MAAPFLSLGRYVPRESPLHRLDARAKLLSALLLAGAAVISGRSWSQLALFLFLVAGFASARLPLQLAARCLRGALWLLLFVGLANAGWFLVTRQVAWANSEASLQRLDELAVLLLRLLNLLLLAALVTATTVPVDAAEALERLLRPLARLRLPVHELGLLLVLSLSFIPIFMQEAQHLAAAHRMKTGTRRWRWRDRLRAVVPLLVPLFLGVLRRADELAVALDARCFEPGAPRTSLVPGHAGRAEALAVAASIAILAGCAWS